MLLVLTLFANSTVEQGQHIMQQVLTEARRNDEAKQHNLTFKRKKEVFVLDKQFIVKSRKQEEVARIMPRNGKSVEEIIERDGRPSNQRSEPGRFDVNIGELLAEVPKHVDFILNDTLSVDEDETRYLTLSMRPKVNPPRNRDRDDTFNALRNIEGSSEREEARMATVIGLLPIGRPSVDILIESLEDDDWLVREAAARLRSHWFINTAVQLDTAEHRTQRSNLYLQYNPARNKIVNVGQRYTRLDQLVKEFIDWVKKE